MLPLRTILGKIYFPLEQYFHWLRAAHLIRRLRIRNYLNNRHELRCLQIGGGPYSIKRWLNGDKISGDIYLNARRPLPFADGSFDYVFTEHFFEHLSLNNGVSFLREVNRILKPGGVLRQSTPSLAAVIDIYLDRHPEVSSEKVLERHFSIHHTERPFRSRAIHINEVMRFWGHQFLYDHETIETLCRDTGFINLKWKKFGESDHDNLCNLERHADVEWMKSGFVIILEAEKPPVWGTENENKN